MDLAIEKRTALVCASSSGIGRAIAHSLAREGAKVAICARSEKKLREAQVSLQSETGSEVIGVIADLRSKDDIQRLIESVNEQLGSIDILVNNVAGPAPGGLMELSDEQWQAGFEQSLMSVVRLTKAVIPEMQRQKWGRIIAIASNTAKEPREGILLSSTLRAAVAAFNKGISQRLAAQNILVHTVCPGPIGTDRVLQFTQDIAQSRGITFEQAQTVLVGNLPMERMGKPEEVASLVSYLASEQSSFMTGNTIVIDGGQTSTW
ncbi:MAG: SDR family oxidoreductase [Cyanobacteria bacterium SID2]|nr:SDR family oxidoreductase [Cyanobacteria bacterium SID2]MBP0006707.1 SDR family oxidoreductase [Cyanobacteria bacterium SBC]